MVFRTLKHCFDILNASLEDAILKEHHIPKGIRATYQKKKKGHYSPTNKYTTKSKNKIK